MLAKVCVAHSSVGNFELLLKSYSSVTSISCMLCVYKNAGTTQVEGDLFSNPGDALDLLWDMLCDDSGYVHCQVGSNV